MASKFGHLGTPWDSIVSDFFTEDQSVSFGRVHQYHMGVIHAEKAQFIPYKGVSLCTPPEIFTIATDGTMDVAVGDWFGLINFTASGGSLAPKDESIFWKVPSGQVESPVSPVHLFSGSFNGWHRAFHFLKNHGIDSHAGLAVDSCEKVQDIWAQSGFEVKSGNAAFSWTHKHDFLCFHGQVQELKWLNYVRDDHCWFTLSPPCQSWSHGGNGSGLSNTNGIAMLHGIKAVKLGRPNVITMECSDRVPTHDHFPIVKDLLAHAGYRLLWMTTHDIAEIVPMLRKRWLAVFIRSDIQARLIAGTFKLSGVQRLTWSDPSFQFPVPAPVRDQLTLTPELMHEYGKFQWLPSNKQGGLNPASSIEQVLDARVLNPNAIMPTLCASYTRQHQLNTDHIDRRGLFTVLSKLDDSWAFFDPLMFIGLMCTPDDLPVVMHVDVSSAFQSIGNCIAVPHAMLAILVAALATLHSEVPVKRTIQKAFEQRLVSDRAVVLCKEGYWWIAGAESIADIFQSLISSQADAAFRLQLGQKWIGINQDVSFAAFLRSSGLLFQRDQVEIVCDGRIFPSELMVECMVGKHITVYINKMTVFDGNVSSMSDLPHDDHVSVGSSPDNHELDEVEITSSQVDAIEAHLALHPHGICAILGLRNEPVYIECELATALQFIQSRVSRQCPELQVTEAKVPADCFGCSKWFIAHDELTPDRAVVVCSHEGSENVTMHYVDRSCEVSAMFNQPGLININGNWICRRSAVVSNGDWIHWQNLPFLISERTRLAIDAGPALANDECSWISRFINQSCEAQFVALPVIVHGRFSSDLNEAVRNPVRVILQNPGQIKKLCIPVLNENHWSAIECTIGDHVSAAFLSFRNPQVSNVLARIINEECTKVGIRCFIRSAIVPSPHGLCGWALLSRWIPESHCWFSSPILEEHPLLACAFFPGGEPLHDLGRLAILAFNARKSFLAMPGPHATEFLVGSADDDEEMSKVDPFLANDPWLQGSKHSGKHAKWEDLTLPADHPFHIKGGDRMSQITRQQISPIKGGICFSTRGHLSEIIASNPKEATVALLPLTDAKFFDRMTPKPETLDPVEIVVCDPISQTIYKRQVSAVVISAQVEVKFAPAAYRASIPEMREMVFEFDSRLNSKEALASMVANPHDAFRHKIQEQFTKAAVQNITLYGFKKFVRSPEHTSFQIIAKIPASFRPSLLEHSAIGELTVRDFLQKSHTYDDVMTLPRFFDASRQGKEEALRCASKVPGFCGLAVTRRGLAVRSWSKDLKTMRLSVLAGDVRITEENAATIPKMQYESHGWPNGILPSQVVKACAFACKTAPVPTRCFRSVGVTSWVLLFQDAPAVTKFSACFNNTTVEIVLTPSQSADKPSAKKSKSQKPIPPKSSNGASSSQPSKKDQGSDEQTSRIAMLENRMNLVESKQESLEQKMVSSFDSVHDQLRQVLAHVAPRSPSHSATGLTPPPKAAKLT
eukprot:Skav214866  [mRNA]  locus=scaffold16:591679:596082:+ [translate_table: standard]